MTKILIISNLRYFFYKVKNKLIVYCCKRTAYQPAHSAPDSYTGSSMASFVFICLLPAI